MESFVPGLPPDAAPLEDFQQVLRLLVAAACGAAVGWERERKSRPAGLRTHMLVAIGACMLALVSLRLAREYGAAVDPSRIIEGIVGGMGFLGAGVIIQSRGRVRGLTTAAGLWVTAAIGIAVAVGSLPIAGAGVALTLVTLTVLRQFEGEASVGDADDGSAVDRDAADSDPDPR